MWHWEKMNFIKTELRIHEPKCSTSSYLVGLVYDGVESSTKARDDCLLIQQQNGGGPVAIARRVVMR